MARPAGSPKIVGVAQGVLSRTRSAQKPRSPDNRIADGAPSGARVEEVLPAKAAGFLADVIEVEAGADQASYGR